MKEGGIIERAFSQFRATAIERRGLLQIDDLVVLIKTLQKNKLDAHCAIVGQNGTGKSMFALALAKKLDENLYEKDNILYAFDNTARFINKLSKNKGSVILCDEINQFFHYRQSGTTEQIALFNFIEVARENSNVILALTRDVRRMNNNFRDGKCSVCVFIVDRFEEDNCPFKSYAMVFVGNPIFEVADKFKIGLLADYFQVNSFEQFRAGAEMLDTFYGYIFLDDISNYIDIDELDIYTRNKRKGIEAVRQKWVKKIQMKEDAEFKKFGKYYNESSEGSTLQQTQ